MAKLKIEEQWGIDDIDFTPGPATPSVRMLFFYTKKIYIKINNYNKNH